jgi:hypothetical protein
MSLARSKVGPQGTIGVNGPIRRTTDKTLVSGQARQDGGYDPVWSADGRALFFITFPVGIMVAGVQTEPTFNRGTPTRAFALTDYSTGGPGRQFDLARDDERFLVRRNPGAQTLGDDTFTGLIVIENWFEELKERVPTP